MTVTISAPGFLATQRCFPGPRMAAHVKGLSGKCVNTDTLNDVLNGGGSTRGTGGEPRVSIGPRHLVCV